MSYVREAQLEDLLTRVPQHLAQRIVHEREARGVRTHARHANHGVFEELVRFFESELPVGIGRHDGGSPFERPPRCRPLYSIDGLQAVPLLSSRGRETFVRTLRRGLAGLHPVFPGPPRRLARTVSAGSAPEPTREVAENSFEIGVARPLVKAQEALALAVCSPTLDPCRAFLQPPRLIRRTP